MTIRESREEIVRKKTVWILYQLNENQAIVDRDKELIDFLIEFILRENDIAPLTQILQILNDSIPNPDFFIESRVLKKIGFLLRFFYFI